MRHSVAFTTDIYLCEREKFYIKLHIQFVSLTLLYDHDEGDRILFNVLMFWLVEILEVKNSSLPAGITRSTERWHSQK